MWWLLPAIGAAVGALTNLNHPDQMIKNMGIGGLLGLGASAIPGATAGAGKLLGITSTTPVTTATGAATNLSPQFSYSQTLGGFVKTAPTLSTPSLSSPAISSFLSATPQQFMQRSATNAAGESLLSKLMISQGGNMLNLNGQQQPQPQPLLGGGSSPIGRPQPLATYTPNPTSTVNPDSMAHFRNFSNRLNNFIYGILPSYWPQLRSYWGTGRS